MKSPQSLDKSYEMSSQFPEKARSPSSPSPLPRRLIPPPTIPLLSPVPLPPLYTLIRLTHNRLLQHPPSINILKHLSPTPLTITPELHAFKPPKHIPEQHSMIHQILRKTRRYIERKIRFGEVDGVGDNYTIVAIFRPAVMLVDPRLRERGVDSER